MKKVILIFLLLIIILLTFFYSFFYISFNLISPENFINTHYRKRFLAHRFLKDIFRLYQVGDARFDYVTDNNFTKLKIIIYYQGDEILWPEAIEKIKREIEKVTQKSEGVIVEERAPEMAISEIVEDKELHQLTKSHPADFIAFKKTAIVRIFVLKKYAPVPTYAGLVKDANNIFLFMEPIRGVSDQQRSTLSMEISTVLHEFAHLLGAGHVKDESCILSERVENLTEGRPATIATNYCPLDLAEIEKAISLI